MMCEFKTKNKIITLTAESFKKLFIIFAICFQFLRIVHIPFSFFK